MKCQSGSIFDSIRGESEDRSISVNRPRHRERSKFYDARLSGVTVCHRERVRRVVAGRNRPGRVDRFDSTRAAIRMSLIQRGVRANVDGINMHGA